MSNLVPNHDAWFANVHGFARPNWTLFEDYILSEVDADRFDEAWNAVAELWLSRIHEQTGSKFHLAQSPNFFLLSPHTERECLRMLQVAERAYARLTHTLGSILTPRFGKVVTLRFVDAVDYYHYVGHFHDEGDEHPMSGGMFLADGLPHIACHSATFEQFAPTLAHELSHLLVAHLPLPAWVNEGVAMSFEQEFGYSHLPDLEAIEKHRKHWDSETIQDFWTGESWRQTGEAFGLSYGLAALIFDVIRKELQPPPDAFAAFVQHADCNDGGAAAARQHLRVELSELVEVLLGPGNWNPR